jgi:hypothetical protein
LKMTVFVRLFMSIGWIQRMFGMQMYHEEMRVMSKIRRRYDVDDIDIQDTISNRYRFKIGFLFCLMWWIRLIENDSFRSFAHEYWMDSKDVWYTDVSWRDAIYVQYTM